MGRERTPAWSHQVTHDQYDMLERAVARGLRIAVRRRGAELVIVPLRLEERGGRELIVASHPTTGDDLNIFLDELETVEVVR